MATVLTGSYPSMSTPPHNQVYNLTHDGDAKRSFVSRAYLSFSYGGKDIEDFGLIATFSDDGKTGNLYGNFEDITSSYSMLDGQFYWGSHFTTNSLTFNLATDGITQNELDDFKHWFRPGQADKELILAEHPNRAILARVAQPPTYTLIPFEYKEKIFTEQQLIDGLSNFNHNLMYVYDDSQCQWTVDNGVTVHGPFFAESRFDALMKIAEEIGFPLATFGTKYPTAMYKGNIQLNFIMDNPFWYLKKNFITIDDSLTDDNLKIIIEDGIPFQSNVKNNCFYGGYTFFSENTQWGAIASNLSSSNPYNLVGKAVLAEIQQIANINSLTLLLDGSLNLFYSGNAPTYPILNFQLTPRLIHHSEEATEACFIYAPYNEYATGSGSLKYNSIYFKINNNIKTVFKFTTPEIYDSYNQVLNYVNTSYNLSWPEFIDLLKNSIRCAPVRAHAIQVAEYFQSQNKTQESNVEFKKYMRAFLTGSIEGLSPSSANFIFNSANGIAIGTFKYYLFNEDFTDVVSEENYQENVGSMVRSNYLVIEEKNQILNGEYQNWYTISTDYPDELSNFLVLYNNMYY